jgi:hypothetical protein
MLFISSQVHELTEKVESNAMRENPAAKDAKKPTGNVKATEIWEDKAAKPRHKSRKMLRSSRDQT